MPAGGGFVNVSSRADYDRTLEEVREANRRAFNEVSLSNAVSRNSVRTADVASDAALCVSNIISRESNRMSDDLSRRWNAGEEVPFSSEALALQQRRHRALLDRVSAFSERLRQQEDQARDRMNAAAEAAR